MWLTRSCEAAHRGSEILAVVSLTIGRDLPRPRLGGDLAQLVQKLDVRELAVYTVLQDGEEQCLLLFAQPSIELHELQFGWCDGLVQHMGHGNRCRRSD